MRRFHDHNVALILWLRETPSWCAGMPLFVSWFTILYLSALSIGHFLPDETWVESVAVSLTGVAYMMYWLRVRDDAERVLWRM